MTTIYDLAQQVSEMGALPASYWDKMMHKIPKTTVVDRGKYILERVKGKVVLDIGASGQMAKDILEVASDYHAIDKNVNSDLPNLRQVDLDRAAHLPPIVDLDIIVAGEIIEHLSNAGHFLELVWEYNRPVILTTPNAFGERRYWLAKGYENVNKDHVAWYSYTTLKALIERHHFVLEEWHWYNGKPITAEGLVFYMRPTNGIS